MAYDCSWSDAARRTADHRLSNRGDCPLSESELVRVERDSRGVGRLILNRPEAKNAMSQDLMRALRTAARELAADSGVRAIVLTGAGDVFSAGGDLKGMQRQVSNT